MAVISGQDYYDIASYYASAMDRLDEVSEDLWDAVYEVVMLQVVDPEVDLLNQFYSAYQINSNITTARSTYLAPVRTIQNHVIFRSDPNYVQNVNDYIWLNVVQPLGLLIPEQWAELSRRAGFPIDDSYVETLP